MRNKRFTNKEFSALKRNVDGDLIDDFWGEDFIWLTDKQKYRLSGDDYTRLDNAEEEIRCLMAEEWEQYKKVTDKKRIKK